MLIDMLKFEWRYSVRQPSFIVISLLFFFIPFLSVAVENVQIFNNNSNINLNSPYYIALTMLVMGFFGMFAVVNFVANTAIRNKIMNMSELLYTRPIQHVQYQIGRFLGAYLIVLTVSLMVPLGAFLGSLMPWLNEEQLGPNSIQAYLVPYILYTMPTCFTLSCLFYAAALRFNSIMAVYLFALGLFTLYVISGTVFSDPSELTLMAVTDPFGVRSFFDFTKYWSPVEKNEQIISLSGVILYNRALWLVVSLAVLLGLGRFFKPLQWHAQQDRKQAEKEANVLPLDNEFNYTYQENSGFRQFLSLLTFEVKQVIFSPAFIVLLIFAVFIVVTAFINPGGNYGSVNYPLTQYMVELIRNAFSLSLLIVITFYTAEVVWRERSTGIGDIIESAPVGNFTIWFSKLLAVSVVIITLLLIGMLATIAYQLVQGHMQLELTQYFISLFYFVAFQFILLAVVAFLIQALSPNKYIGMLLFVGFLFIPLLFNSAGIQHNMFNYSGSPLLQYSDMNQYGWFLITQHYYMTYWSALALVIGAFSFALWQRGPESNLRARFGQLGYGLGKLGQTLVVIGFVVFISIGTVIHYNTKVINEFYTLDEIKQIKADYEKAFAQYEDKPIPITTAVKLDVAIFPELRKLEVVAELTLENKSEEEIESFLVNYPNFSSIEIQGAEVANYNSRFKTAWVSFKDKLAPGEQKTIRVFVTRMHRGFKDSGEDSKLVKNGTFITNTELLPNFGVNRSEYLSDAIDRRKYGLSQYVRAFPLEDSSRYRTSFFGKNASKIKFKATLSTSENQIAIAPGYLDKYWTEGGRNYFVYKMDIPMVNFYNIMSADYEVKTAMHNGIETAIYYHPNHHWNVDRMIASSSDAIDFFSQVFGPYQYRQMRIIEFPGYASYAQSFANTVPYSEKIGFITDLRDPDKIDLVYYVTAHEVAHQWFGHQLEPANVQGAQILSEALSQYAALQLMQKEYGEVKIRKFLTYELDNYLRGRANETIQEMPFMRDEGQSYIYYNKASIVMMAIADRIGTEQLNIAIKSLIQDFKHNDNRLATTLDLLAAIKQYSEPMHHQYIEEQFSQILLYDIRLNSATVQEEVGKLELQVQTGQVEIDADGNEIKSVFSNYVDVLVFDGNPNDFDEDTKVLYKKRWLLQDGQNSVTIDLKDIESPDAMRYVGVDPFVRYIDRNSKDNIIKL